MVSCAKLRSMSRTTSYSLKVANEICARLAEGEPLRVICRDDHMPAWRTVYDWRSADPEFAARIAHARDVGFDAIAEEALEIADTPVEGVRREVGTDGVKAVHEDMLGHRKLQVETRLKLLAKWSPSRYGDKQQIEHSGHLELGKMSDEELDAELAALAAVAVATTQPPDDGSDLV